MIKRNSNHSRSYNMPRSPWGHRRTPPWLIATWIIAFLFAASQAFILGLRQMAILRGDLGAFLTIATSPRSLGVGAALLLFFSAMVYRNRHK